MWFESQGTPRTKTLRLRMSKASYTKANGLILKQTLHTDWLVYSVRYAQYVVLMRTICYD